MKNKPRARFSITLAQSESLWLHQDALLYTALKRAMDIDGIISFDEGHPDILVLSDDLLSRVLLILSIHYRMLELVKQKMDEDIVQFEKWLVAIQTVPAELVEGSKTTQTHIT